MCDHNEMNAAQTSHVLFGHCHLQQFKTNTRIFKKTFFKSTTGAIIVLASGLNGITGCRYPGIRPNLSTESNNSVKKPNYKSVAK